MNINCSEALTMHTTTEAAATNLLLQVNTLGNFTTAIAQMLLQAKLV